MLKPQFRQFFLVLLLVFLVGMAAGLIMPRNTGFTPPDDGIAAFSMEVVTPAPAPSPETDGFSLEVISRETTPKKRVLIYHTHTYEAYQNDPEAPYTETSKWRTASSDHNVVKVGKELAQLLHALGLEVVHDTTAFEPPALDSSYTRSLDMLTRRMQNGENFDLIIDLHRDAFISGQEGHNTVSFGGKELARIMFLIGKGDGQTGQGFDQKPEWEKNLVYASGLTDALNAQVPGLCKNVLLKSGRFNQHVSVGCVLVEVGNNQNTLSQALSSMPYLADAIRQLLCED